MTTSEMTAKVKVSLQIASDERDLAISDVIQDALHFCNLAEPPDEMEPYVRKKVQTIINYESENGLSTVFDVKSVKEGDTSITYNVDENSSRETIYGLSDRDKLFLRGFRRTRK